VVVPVIIMIYAVGIPLWSLGRVLATPHRGSAAAAAVIATACCLPLQLWLLIPLARARRQRRAGLLIAVFAAVSLAAFPFIGVPWFAAGEELAVLLVVYLRPRWSVPLVAGLAAVPAGLAIAGQEPFSNGYFAQNTLFWPLTIGLLIWLVRAAAELRATRQELADAAVIRERVRMDDEFGATLGTALEQMISAVDRAGSLAGPDPAGAERELRALTTASRRTLTQTRGMVSQYQAITVGSELRTAVALLAAAGIAATANVPAALQEQALSGQPLDAFRGDLTGVLHDDAATGCVISAVGANGGVRLAISRQHGPPA
jgi:two-component system sensor histidine kinase DesK